LRDAKVERAHIKNFDVGLTSFYDLRHVERDYYCCSSLMERGYSVLVFTNSDDITHYFKKRGIEAVSISGSEESPAAGSVTAEIKRIRDTYGISHSFSRLVETTYLQNRPLYPSRREAVARAVQMFRNCESVFENTRIETLFQLYTADIERLALWYVAKRHCKRVFAYTASGLPERELILVEDEDFRVRGLYEAFARQTEGEEGVFDEIRDAVLRLKKKNEYLPAPQVTIKKRMQKLPYVLERLQKSNKLSLVKHYFVQLALNPARERAVRSLHEMPDPSEQYIFYPLHAPIEDQVIVRGFPLRNEFDLIETIALSMPCGYNLYVKEHPGYAGFYPVRSYRRIAALEQVKLVPPGLNSHELIERAALCIVINSTVWLEALLLGTTVITLGKGFFSGYGVCREVANLDDLDTEIERALETGLDQNAARKFVSSLYAVSYQHTFRYYLRETPEVAGGALGDLVARLARDEERPRRKSGRGSGGKEASGALD